MATKEEQIRQAQETLTIAQQLAKDLQISLAEGIEPTKVAPGAEATLAKELQTKLLSELDIVTSEPTELETTIGGAITGIEEAREARERGIEAAYERERIGVREVGERGLIGVRERMKGLGPASTLAVIQRTEKATEESLRDLDLREQEALAAGQTEVAVAIANLKVQQLQFRIQMRQQMFENLLGLTRLGFERERVGFEEKRVRIAEEGLTLEERQVSVAEARQAQEERAAMANIALQFGLALRADDTLDTVISRAEPLASQEQQLKMERARAEIANLRAQTQLALTEAKGVDEATLDILAQAALVNPDALSVLKNPTDIAKAISKMQTLQQARDWNTGEIETEVVGLQAGGKTFGETFQEIMREPTLKNKEEAVTIARRIYNQPKKDIYDVAFQAWRTLKQKVAAPSPEW